ncbi:MAG: DUF493 domain-containing protein [Flavobacteriales bacterium]|nr:DUF493 domain-containing protein [Flavobacteriales bacterium]
MSDENPFLGLLDKLKKDGPWPKLYLFKFVIPNDTQKLALTEGIFGSEAQVSINESRTGKYLSVSAKEVMISPEEVVERYEQATKIEGLISL